MPRKQTRFVYWFWVNQPTGSKIKAFGWVDGTNREVANKYIEYYCKKEGYELISIEERNIT